MRIEEEGGEDITRAAYRHGGHRPFDYTGLGGPVPEQAPIVGIGQATGYFEEATLYQANDGSGPICDAVQQASLLNMVTAHIAKLYQPTPPAIAGQQVAPGPVGRVASASEGSVSVSLEMSGSEASAWWNQTPYGASWWKATAQYRTMRYRPGYPYNPRAL